MRIWIIALGLLLFLFIVPLQFFVIGNDYGYGFQGAIYRYQVTSIGQSLIPLPYEIGYVISGLYSGTSALSIILWAIGSLLLSGITLISLIRWNMLSRSDISFFFYGMVGIIILYCASCICRYGPFFSGAAGFSLPAGIIILAMFAVFLYFFSNVFLRMGTEPVKQMDRK